MELIELTAKSREKSGKGAARKLRRDSRIPAMVYGPKSDPVKLSIAVTDFDKIIRENGSTGLFFNLKIQDESSQEKIAMLKDVQMDAFGLNYLHVDLHEIDMDTKVTVSVPVEAIGVSHGVKEGGLLQIIRRELDIICKPSDTPDSVQIDITELAVGDSVHVEDIDLGKAIDIPHEVNFTVITIVPPTVDEPDEEEGEDFEALETEGEGEEESEAPAEE